eukprot:1158660-Pelagomonas_calceolata.AAC.3
MQLAPCYALCNETCPRGSQEIAAIYAVPDLIGPHALCGMVCVWPGCSQRSNPLQRRYKHTVHQRRIKYVQPTCALTNLSFPHGHALQGKVYREKREGKASKGGVALVLGRNSFWESAKKARNEVLNSREGASKLQLGECWSEQRRAMIPAFFGVRRMMHPFKVCWYRTDTYSIRSLYINN